MGLFIRFCWVSRWVFSAICFVMMFVVRPVYIIFVVVCRIVGALHRSRVDWWRGAVGIRRGFFLRSIVMSVGVAVVFNGTYSYIAIVFILILIAGRVGS